MHAPLRELHVSASDTKPATKKRHAPRTTAATNLSKTIDILDDETSQENKDDATKPAPMKKKHAPRKTAAKKLTKTIEALDDDSSDKDEHDDGDDNDDDFSFIDNSSYHDLCSSIHSDISGLLDDDNSVSVDDSDED